MPPIQDTKEEVEHEENAANHVPLPVRRISFLQTLRTYPMASALCILAAAGGLSDGYQVQNSGSIVALPGFIEQFGKLQGSGTYKLDPQQVSLWGSLKNVAAMFGGLVGGYPADIIGRKWMILVVHLVMVGGVFTELYASHWTHWLAARLLDGFSIGLAQCCLTVYVAELAPTQSRGALMSFFNITYNIGSFLSSIALQTVSQLPPGEWRRAVWCQFVLSGIGILCWIPLPESPRWLCSRGREADSRKMLRRVNGKVKGYDEDEEYARLVYELDAEAALRSISSGGSYLDCFRRANLRRTIASALPWHSQVANGVPIMGTYSAYFWKMAGLTNPYIGTISVNAVGLLAGVFGIYLVEWSGRRRLILSFAPVCVASLLIIGILVKTGGPGSAMVTFACAWTAGEALSYGATGWLYVAETSTQRLRLKTTSVCVFFIQAMATVYVYIAPIMLNAPKLGMSNTVFFWAGTGTLVLILNYLLVPETKGRSYAELDELFDRGIPAWRFRKTETSEDARRRVGPSAL